MRDLDPKVLLVLLALVKLNSLGVDLINALPELPTLGPLPQYRRSSKDLWKPEEMRYFAQELSPVGLDLESLLLVIHAESGCNPHAKNGQYVGLMQTGNELRDAVKFPGSAADYQALDVFGQCPWLAKILRVQLARLGRMPADRAELWAMNLAPARLKARSEVLYNRERNPKEYEGNKALDLGRDGDITIDDLGRVLSKLSLQTYYLNQRDLLRDAVRALRA